MWLQNAEGEQTPFWITRHDPAGKLQGIHSLNTPTQGNKFCEHALREAAEWEAEGKLSICGGCYERNKEKRHKNAVAAYSRNLVLATRPMREKDIPILPRYMGLFRLQSGGETVNLFHARNMIMLATKNPWIRFSLLSKKPELWRETIRRWGKPENMVFTHSVKVMNILPGQEPAIPDGFDNQFLVYQRKFAVKHGVEINCNTKCIDCNGGEPLCYFKNGITIRELKR